MKISLNINQSTMISARYKQVLVIAISTLSLFFVFTLLQQCHRGIDLTDEGFYINWISNPWLYKSSVTQFGYIYHPLYQLVGENIIRLRQADMLIMLGLSWVLCTQLIRYIFPRDDLATHGTPVFLYSVALCLATTIFAFFGSVWWLPTPSYNSLVLESALLISIGLLQLSTNSIRMTGYVILGFGYWLAFMAKPTAAILLGFFSFLYLLLITGKKFKITHYMLTCIIAVVLICISAWVIDGSIPAFIERLQSGLEQRSLISNREPFNGFMPMYGWLLNEPKRSVFFLLITSVFLITNLSTLKRLEAQYACFYIGLYVGYLILTNAYIVPIDQTESLAQGLLTQTLLLVVPLGALLTCILMSHQPLWSSLSSTLALTRFSSKNPGTPKATHLMRQKYHFVCLSAYFLVLPFLCTFGTLMDFWTNSLRLSFFFVLAVFPLVALVKQPFYVRWRMVLSIIICSQLLTITLVQQTTEHPYHQKQPLRLQNQRIDIPHGNGEKTTKMIVSDNDARYINELKQTAFTHGFIHGDSILDFSSSPTVIYFLGAQAIGTAWQDIPFASEPTRIYDYLRSVLLTIPCDTLANAWILAPVNYDIKDVFSVLEPDGVNQKTLASAGGIIGQLDTYHGYVRYQQLMQPIGDHQETILRCEKNRKMQHAAQQAIRKILNETVPSTQGIIERSVAFMNNQNANRAIALLKEAIILNPVSADLYNNLCVAYGIEKNYTDAVSACSSALRIAPDFQLAKNNLEWVMREKTNLKS